MSDTPETDAQITTFDSISSLGKRFKNRTGTVSAILCRQMELERNKYRHAVELIAEDCESWLKSECDEPSVEFIKLVAKYAREVLQ